MILAPQLDLGAAAETEALKAPYRCDAEVHFCNRNSSAVAVRLRHVPADSVPTDAMYVLYGHRVAGNGTYTWTARVEQSERLLVYSDTANVSVMVGGRRVSQ